jgi:hypothetical protein
MRKREARPMITPTLIKSLGAMALGIAMQKISQSHHV